MECFSLEQLADLAEGRSGAAERSTLERHMAKGCGQCQTNWQWVQRIYALTAADTTLEPPDWLVKRALAAFANQKAAPKKAGFHKIIAALVFDSFSPLQFADLRKVGEAGRQLVYRADAYDIDLRFLPSENVRRENVIGQVLGPRPDFSDVSGAQVVVCKGKRKIASVETNEVGVFNLHNLPQGKYDLTIRLGTQEVHIGGAATSGYKESDSYPRGKKPE
jgi:hypothetical protein